MTKEHWTVKAKAREAKYQKQVDVLNKFNNLRRTNGSRTKQS